MRIGVAIDALSPHLTGIGRYTWELCKGLAEHEAIADIAYFRFDNWVQDPSRFLSSEGKDRGHKFRAPRKIRKWQSKFNFRNRLFHGPNFFLPEYVEEGVVTVHDLSVLRYPETHPKERVLAFERGFTKSLARASHIITDSETVKSEIVDLCGLPKSHVTAIPLGISSAYGVSNPNRLSVLQKYGLSSGGYILCVATFEPRKRIDAAILAHELMCERNSINIPLVLVGAVGWRNEALHELIDSGRRRGRLLSLGYIPEVELPIIYSGAKLFIYPSIYEGFGLPPIEAMACGVPTIVSNRSCLPEITAGAAMLVDPDNVIEFSQFIERGLSDGQWRSDAIQLGMTVASKYSWRNCIDQTVRIYQKISGSE